MLLRTLIHPNGIRTVWTLSSPFLRFLKILSALRNPFEDRIPLQKHSTLSQREPRSAATKRASLLQGSACIPSAGLAFEVRALSLMYAGLLLSRHLPVEIVFFSTTNTTLIMDSPTSPLTLLSTMGNDTLQASISFNLSRLVPVFYIPITSKNSFFSSSNIDQTSLNTSGHVPRDLVLLSLRLVDFSQRFDQIGNRSTLRRFARYFCAFTIASDINHRWTRHFSINSHNMPICKLNCWRQEMRSLSRYFDSPFYSIYSQSNWIMKRTPIKMRFGE